jgi:hypothetical protein
MARGPRGERPRIGIALQKKRMFAREHCGDGVVAYRLSGRHDFFELRAEAEL